MIRNLIAKGLEGLASLIKTKAGAEVAGVRGTSTFTPGGYIDAYRKHRAPTPKELVEELKNTAWTCATINAAVCAAFPPKLYVSTQPGQDQPKCRTKAISKDHPAAIKRKGMSVQEVEDHPIITLLKAVNPIHNEFDLWELTQLYMESHGSAYWLCENGIFGVPDEIWVLPSHKVTARRESGSPQIIDWYEYLGPEGMVKYLPEQIIHFRFPDPKDPYTSGLSPLRACFEQVAIVSQYVAMKRSVYENVGMPSVILSPDEVIGEDERIRLEEMWNTKFRKGGTGKALVAESKLDVRVLSHSMGDLAALAEMRATKEDICNAFHVPVAYMTGETNMANMQASENMHMKLCIKPRLQRRDQKLNEQLIPRFDPSGRLFVASEDPTPQNQEDLLKRQESDLKSGVVSINEVRSERGLPPVPWGDTPYAQMPQMQQG